MQNKRDKRSKIRAARRTAGHGSKKKHRGSGHRGGFGHSNIGKRGSAKIQKEAGSGGNIGLGKHGFKSLEKKVKAINLQELQGRLLSYLNQGLITKSGSVYSLDLDKIGYQKLLSKGTVLEKMNIRVESATETAVEKVTAAGGKVETTEKPQATEEVK
jgi:large subunit ribosomal protein L15